METSHAQLIIDRLNEKCEIDYCGLNEFEVVLIILEAYKEQEEFLSNDK